jgi:hypothetical protein
MKMKMLTLLFVFAYATAACGASTPAPTSLPPAATLRPTPESPKTQDPAIELLTFPESICCNGRTVEVGVYEIPSWTGIPLTLEVGEGWRAINEEAALLFMLGQGRNAFNDPTQVLVFIAVPNGIPQSVLTSIKREPGLTPESEITDITIAGFSGLQLDLTAKPNPGYEGDKEAEILPGSQFLPAVNKYFTPGFIWTTWTAESRLRFIVLNVGEQILLIEIESPPNEFEAFASEADRVLQTLKLRR